MVIIISPNNNQGVTMGNRTFSIQDSHNISQMEYLILDLVAQTKTKEINTSTKNMAKKNRI